MLSQSTSCRLDLSTPTVHKKHNSHRRQYKHIIDNLIAQRHGLLLLLLQYQCQTKHEPLRLELGPTGNHHEYRVGGIHNGLNDGGSLALPQSMLQRGPLLQLVGQTGTGDLDTGELQARVRVWQRVVAQPFQCLSRRQELRKQQRQLIQVVQRQVFGCQWQWLRLL